jgi:hypothetical protein
VPFIAATSSDQAPRRQTVDEVIAGAAAGSLSSEQGEQCFLSDVFSILRVESHEGRER